MLKIIPDARHAWRFGSVQAALLLALLSGIQADALPLLQPIFGPEVWPYISGGLALAVVVLRLTQQPDLYALRAADAQAAYAADLAAFELEAAQLMAEKRRSDAEELEQARVEFNAAIEDHCSRRDQKGPL